MSWRFVNGPAKLAQKGIFNFITNQNQLTTKGKLQ